MRTVPLVGLARRTRSQSLGRHLHQIPLSSQWSDSQVFQLVVQVALVQGLLASGCPGRGFTDCAFAMEDSFTQPALQSARCWSGDARGNKKCRLHEKQSVCTNERKEQNNVRQGRLFDAQRRRCTCLRACYYQGLFMDLLDTASHCDACTVCSRIVSVQSCYGI